MRGTGTRRKDACREERGTKTWEEIAATELWREAREEERSKMWWRGWERRVGFVWLVRKEGVATCMQGGGKVQANCWVFPRWRKQDSGVCSPTSCCLPAACRLLHCLTHSLLKYWSLHIQYILTDQFDWLYTYIWPWLTVHDYSRSYKHNIADWEQLTYYLI